MTTDGLLRPDHADTAGRGGPPVYQASRLSMSFGGVRALSDVSIDLRPGEVHALLGANGAGKSTLVKILAGVQQPTTGELALDGQPVRFTSARGAVQAGIATVSQELNLYPDLSVLENLFIMREPLRFGVLTRRSEMRARAVPALQRVGLSPEILDLPVRQLSLAVRQLVEITRALLEEPKVLILDEPTSALKASETRQFLNVVTEMKGRGVAVVFVTHFIDDAFEVSDVVTVLRGGRLVEQAVPLSRMTPESVIEAMLGTAGGAGALAREAEGELPLSPVSTGIGPLVLEDVSVRGSLDSVSLTAEPGEVVGLAGLEGSGASETMRLLFGDLKRSDGLVRLPTGGGAPRSPLAAVRSGVAYIPADRQAQGLIIEHSIKENLSSVIAGPLKRLGLLPSERDKTIRAERWRQPLRLVMASPDLPVSGLSGGNQQKVVFAKWLETSPTLVQFDDPTRGVDVGAKSDMMQIVRSVAESGRVVLYTSTDLGELVSVCDRIIVFYRGRVVGEMTPPWTEHELLESITRGVSPSSVAHTRAESSDAQTRRTESGHA